MNWIKYLIIIPVFLVLAVLQASFLPHFGVRAITPNLVFILFFVVTFFEDTKEYIPGLCLAIVTGIILGVFYPLSLFSSALIMIGIYSLYKLATHFISRGSNFPALYFMLAFLICFFIYTQLYAFLLFHAFFWNMGLVAIELVYNGFAAIIVFYAYQFLEGALSRDRQLRLF